MIIKTDNRNNEPGFYTETVNIIGQYVKLLRKPDAKLKDMFKQYRSYRAALALLLFVLGIEFILLEPDRMMYFAAGIDILAELLLTVVLWNMNKKKEDLMADKSERTVEINELSVTYTVQGKEPFTIEWKDMAFVRIFDETVAFFPSDKSRKLIVISSDNADALTAYMNDSGIDARIIL